jgi:hypothetical protein
MTQAAEHPKPYTDIINRFAPSPQSHAYVITCGNTARSGLPSLELPFVSFDEERALAELNRIIHQYDLTDAFSVGAFPSMQIWRGTFQVQVACVPVTLSAIDEYTNQELSKI